MNKIICLDIDECIFPSTSERPYWVPMWSLEQLESNLKRLLRLIYITKSRIFITSSWSCLFDFYEGEFSVIAKDEVKEQWNKSTIDYEFEAYKIITKYLNGYICGISSGNRDDDIKDLDDGKNRIVVFDDFDLLHLRSKNVLICRIYGSLDLNVLRKSFEFLKE